MSEPALSGDTGIVRGLVKDDVPSLDCQDLATIGTSIESIIKTRSSAGESAVVHDMVTVTFASYLSNCSIDPAGNASICTN
jgi:hypothetical protein